MRCSRSGSCCAPSGRAGAPRLSPEPPLESRGKIAYSSGRGARSRNTIFRRVGMIIECQTCHARFRLDEARIKGRGARVKCRKCGESIVVFKDSAPAPPAPRVDGPFDLGAAMRESAGEAPPSPPPVGNLIPFPAPSRPAETGMKESSSLAPEAAGPEKDEVDLAFERVLSAGAGASFPTVGETEVAKPAPEEASAPQGEEAPAG